MTLALCFWPAKIMTTPTKQPILSQGILTPSCDITPTRETAREDDAYDEFASCVRAVGVGVLVGAAVYVFHDDGTDFQVPARAVHHVEQALVHVKLALDVARQLHFIS